VQVPFLFVWSCLGVDSVSACPLYCFRGSLNQDEVIWLSGIFSHGIGWWLVVTSAPDIFSLDQFIGW
jgi:hypothetical protein